MIFKSKVIWMQDIDFEAQGSELLRTLLNDLVICYIVGYKMKSGIYFICIWHGMAWQRLDCVLWQKNRLVW